MAFTVGADGNSYITVAYANTYFADRVNPDWTGADTAKQGAAVRATDYVRAAFGARFNPALFAAGLPDILLRAVCEYALVELKAPGSLAPAPAVDASGYTLVQTKRKVGPLEKTFAVAGGDSAKKQVRRSYPVADALIASLLLPVSQVNRVIR